jgi:Family of unknown function (DUF6524)
MGRLTLGGFGARFLASLALVFVTYNPSGYSYLSWIRSNFPHIEPAQAVIGIGLLAIWIFFVHATWRSLGALGVCLGTAFFAAVVWLLSSWGWLGTTSHNSLVWLALLIVAFMLTIGLCWGLIRVRVSGQAVVEEVQR